MLSNHSLATFSFVLPGLTHDHWQQVSIVLDLPIGNVTATVSDKTSRSARLPPDTVEKLIEFFRSADRTATVYLGGQYHSLYLLVADPGFFFFFLDLPLTSSSLNSICVICDQSETKL